MCYFYSLIRLTKQLFMNISRWLLVLLLFAPLSEALSQVIEISEVKSEPSTLADSLFNAEDYSQALPLYLELCQQYPRDIHYNYALGVCYINTSREIETALSYLLKASRGEAPNKVYYYIAEAYRRNYHFDLAIDYYRRFTINGGSKDISTSDIEKRLAICENGTSMLKYIYTPQVIDRKRFTLNDFFQYYSNAPKTGSFIVKPDNLKSPTDIKQKEWSIIFSPSTPQTNDYIYYSSYGKSTINGKDIYRIKRLEDGYWSKPENLGTTVNSSEDEDFPYISPDGKTLYFASKGHYNIGGYDIFKSTFDSTTNKWSEPENIGFPISSTFDDFLYIPDTKERIACFATNRNTDGDSVEVVMYKMEVNPILRSFTTYEEAQRVAKLRSPKDKVIKNIKVDDGTLDREKNPFETPEVKTKPATFNTVENDPEYIRLITKGFSKQKETDSLRTKLEKLRSQFDYVTTAEQRRSLESKVVKVENALLAAQNEADKMFVQASQIEQEYLTGKRKSKGSDTTLFANDNPDYIYQAQFAPTVFRSDEINKLAQVEKLFNQINTARDEAISAKAKYNSCIEKQDSTTNCNGLSLQMVKKMNAYSALVSKWIDVKYKIYNDCIMVAIVKSGNNNGDGAKAEVERANSHFRAASAIKNNLSSEGREESLFESSILYEIGILRLELAFARTWGMNLFEQETTSRVMKLEKIAFGSPLPPVVNKTNIEVVENKTEEKQEVAISKVETKNLNIEPILIKNDETISFQIVDKTPYDAENPIPVNEQLPYGVVYKIQLGAYSKPLDISAFKGMIPVSIERIEGAKVSKYFIGRFDKFSEAEKALTTIKSKGFKDAFIVAWYNGKPVPTSRAQSMEDKSETTKVVPVKNNTDATSDKGKIYIVQIGKYTNKLPDGIYQTVKAIASGKDIIRKPSDQGLMLYSIGNYSTLEEANRVRDNLIASGLTGVVVVGVDIEKK